MFQQIVFTVEQQKGVFAMVTIIDMLFMFLLLPVLIGSDSKKRIGRVSWEWIIFGFLGMSMFSALLQDIIVPLWFSAKSLFNVLVVRGIILAGVGLFFGIYSSADQPIKPSGKKWKWFRSLCAVFILAVLVVCIAHGVQTGTLERPKGRLGSLLLVLGALAFIVAQVGMYTHRDQKKIEEYNRKKVEKQAAIQASASGKTDTDEKANAEQKGGSAVDKPRASP
jgi:hypothetical protein